MSQASNLEERKTLWVGDVQTWMDENYLRSLFAKTGHIQSVKIMRDKVTNQPVGYGFIEFTSHEVAAKVLQLFTGSINPATNKPFKLNWGVYGGSSNAPALPLSSKNVPVYRGSHHPDGPFSSTSRLGAKLSGTIENKVSVYVGDMDITINQDQLLNHFLAKCPTALTSKIIVDPKTQLSKGYGFVTFATKEEADKAIHLMDGTKLRGKPIKCRPSYIKTNNSNNRASPDHHEKSMHGKMPNSKYPTYQNPANNALPTLGMGVGGTSGRRTSGFMAQQRESTMQNQQRAFAVGRQNVQGVGMGVGAMGMQQQYQQIMMQYQQVLQQQRYLASQPALLQNPIYYQQYLTNQAFLTNQSMLVASIAQSQQYQVANAAPQMQPQKPEKISQEVTESSSRYHENPFLHRFEGNDAMYIEEGDGEEGMEVEEIDDIDSTPKLAVYKFMQEFGVAN